MFTFVYFVARKAAVLQRSKSQQMQSTVVDYKHFVHLETK